MMEQKRQNKKMKVLLIEDDRIDQKAFERHIRSEGLPYDYAIAGSVTEGKNILKSEKFDVVISDYQLADGTGLDVLAFDVETPVIITTGTGSEEIAVQAMRAGAFDYLIKDPDRYYLKVLAFTIERTLKRKETEGRIRMLSHAVTSIHDSVLIADKEDRVIFINHAFMEIYGVASDDLIGHPAAEFWKTAAGSVPQKSEGEFLHKNKDGEKIPVLMSCSALKDEKGAQIATVYIMLDITERKQAQAELLRRTKELARSKTELEQLELFAFIATHDLQEPLHKIKTMVTMLNKRSGELLDEESRGFLASIGKSVDRLGQRMDSTRDFARVMKEGRPFKKFELRELLNGLLDAEGARFRELQGALRLEGSFPRIEADRSQIGQLFTHLLSNALKFRRVDAAPQVCVRGSEEPAGWLRVSVEDNGLGVEEKYRERIFEPFERVHDAPEQEGTGMGLAICQKIVLRHGGRIKLESTVGKGSAFIITLPTKQDKGGA